MTASGLLGRRLRSRRRFTAAGQSAADQELKAPQPLEGQNPTFAQLGRGGTDGLGGERQDAAVGVPRRKLRPTCMAGDRLGMETARFRIAVLSIAVRAQREGCHACGVPVIRHAHDQGEARPAFRASGQRVAAPAVAGVHDFPQTLRAHGAIRRHTRPAGSPVVAPPGKDTEGVEACRGGRRAGYGNHRRRGWSSAAELGLKAGQTVRLTLCVDGYPLGVVANPAGQAPFPRQAVHERAEPHALHDAAHSHAHRCKGDGGR